MGKLTMQPNANAVAFKELFDEFIRFKTLQNLSPQSIRYYEDFAFFGRADKRLQNTAYDIKTQQGCKNTRPNFSQKQ
ncbi:MAG: hypothetical protein FWF92_00775 [Oscillospiraceae bacterium]|nr:hypothetical protein [Oscillospiraceae bacterium]